jgi:Ca2+-binding EF-hand superfamily protein
MEQLKLEKEIEDAKVSLSAQPDFNLLDAFQMLDITAKGWLTVPELYDALQELGHHTHKQLVFMFIRHFDRDSDGKLLYSDFCDAFTPKATQ